MVNAGDTIGAYRIVSPLGTGGMGQVWSAEHTLLGRRVAIKLLRPELSERADIVDRFFDEARAAAQIDDPGIVAVHDFGRHEGRAYIVMEQLSGEVLSARLARVNRLPLRVAARLGVHAAITMAVAHGRGIVHRDLKPENMIVVPDPAVIGGERLKILDFGIAKLLVDHDVTNRTQTGALLGTPTYMSPEQCRSSGRVDHRTDIYALGCVLFHLVCGRPPFVGTSSGDLIAAHIVDEPVAPSSLVVTLPAAFDAIIARCLAKSPDDRIASMSELARALTSLAEMSIDIATIPPLLVGPPNAEGSRDTPVAASTPTRDPVGFLPTLATDGGETHRAVSRRTLVIVAAAALAIVGAIVVLVTGSPKAVPPMAPAIPSSAEATTAPSATPDAVTVPAASIEPRPDAGSRADAGAKERKPRRRGSGSGRDEGAYEFDDP